MIGPHRGFGASTCCILKIEFPIDSRAQKGVVIAGAPICCTVAPPALKIAINSGLGTADAQTLGIVGRNLDKKASRLSLS
jgi:hypothetical protein